MSGAIAQRANETSKALGGKASYLWATFAVFARWPATEIEVTVDDERRSGRMFDVVVANGRFFGGGMQICPEADAGRRSLRRAHDRRRHEARPRARRCRRSTAARTCRTRRRSCCAARRSRSRRDEPVPIELDGEQPGTTPVRFEVLPGALRLRVPRAAPRLGHGLARRRALWGGRLLRTVAARDLLLEPRDALLELVDPAHPLPELVDAAAGR